MFHSYFHFAPSSKNIYPKCIFAKCTRLACLLSFASLSLFFCFRFFHFFLFNFLCTQFFCIPFVFTFYFRLSDQCLPLPIAIPLIRLLSCPASGPHTILSHSILHCLRNPYSARHYQRHSHFPQITWYVIMKECDISVSKLLGF